MASPSCPKCNHKSFSSSPITPKGFNGKVLAIHCSKCGAVVGIAEANDIAGLIQGLAEALKVTL